MASASESMVEEREWKRARTSEAPSFDELRDFWLSEVTQASEDYLSRQTNSRPRNIAKLRSALQRRAGFARSYCICPVFFARRLEELVQLPAELAPLLKEYLVRPGDGEDPLQLFSEQAAAGHIEDARIEAALRRAQRNVERHWKRGRVKSAVELLYWLPSQAFLELSWSVDAVCDALRARGVVSVRDDGRLDYPFFDDAMAVDSTSTKTLRPPSRAAPYSKAWRTRSVPPPLDTMKLTSDKMVALMFSPEDANKVIAKDKLPQLRLRQFLPHVKLLPKFYSQGQLARGVEALRAAIAEVPAFKFELTSTPESEEGIFQVSSDCSPALASLLRAAHSVVPQLGEPNPNAAEFSLSLSGESEPLAALAKKAKKEGLRDIGARHVYVLSGCSSSPYKAKVEASIPLQGVSAEEAPFLSVGTKVAMPSSSRVPDQWPVATRGPIGRHVVWSSDSNSSEPEGGQKERSSSRRSRSRSRSFPRPQSPCSRRRRS